MRTKICKRCGKPFATDKATSKCPDCVKAIRVSAAKAPHTCIDCGVRFMGGMSSKRCPDCAYLRRQETQRASRARGTARPLGSTDHCERCGAEYPVEGGAQKYCKACAKIAVYEKIRERKLAYMAKYHADHQRVKPDTVCQICGKRFQAVGAEVTCSPECARENSYRWQAEADVKRGRRQEAKHYVSGYPKSGIIGITWYAKGNRWIVKYGKKYIGLANTIEEAVKMQNRYKEENK